MAATTSRRGHQTFISGETWHRRIKKETFPVDILVETGADGGFYMFRAFYHMIAKRGRLVTSVRKDGKGTLNAATLPSNKPTPLTFEY